MGTQHTMPFLVLRVVVVVVVVLHACVVGERASGFCMGAVFGGALLGASWMGGETRMLSPET